MRLHQFMTATTLMATLLGGVSATEADDTSIIIGLATAESGFMAAYDGDAVNSVKLWAAEQNAKGGLLGRQITFVNSDTKSDRAQGARAGQEVIDNGAKILMVTCDYDYGSPAAGAAQRAGLMSVFLCAEDPKAGVQGAGAYAFSTSVAAQLQGAVMAEWSVKKLGIKTAYTLLDTGEYANSVCAGFNWGAEQAGLEIVGADTIKNPDASFQTQITRIATMAVQPDALMLCSFVPGAATLLRQIRAAGLTMPVFASSSMDGTYWLDAVPDLRDFYVPVQASIYGNDPRPDVNSFMDNYAKAYGYRPTTSYAVPVYAFLELWARAVEKAQSVDTSKVVTIMEEYKDEPTLIGPRTFTPEWHIQRDALMLVVSYDKGETTILDQFRISAPIPTEVLFRQ